MKSCLYVCELAIIKIREYVTNADSYKQLYDKELEKIKYLIKTWFKINIYLCYQAETNEQNSGENWSGGAEGGGVPTIACKSS